MSLIFSIVNQKGGVGKTTTSVNLATAFAAMGHPTLLIDLDPQGNTSTGIGFDYSERKRNIYDVMVSQCDPADVILKTSFPDLDVITSVVDLAASDIELVDVENREFILKNCCDSIREKYRFVIIDCPPSLGLLTINALVSSNFVVIPSQCEFYSLEGLTHLLHTIDLVKKGLNPDLILHGIVLTMYDMRNKVTRQVEDDIRKNMGDKVYKTFIPRNVRLSEAPSYGKPAVIYDVNCAGSRAYLRLAREILESLHE